MVEYRDIQHICTFLKKWRKISLKVSANLICYLEWDSQDPPQFPGLLAGASGLIKAFIKLNTCVHDEMKVKLKSVLSKLIDFI